jgi:hypothetical protein
MERIRDSGLELFHAAMMRAFDLGCQPHGGAMWCGIQTDFLKAARYFEEAQTPGLRGGLTSNMRLQALALLEAASVGIDAGQDGDMAISLQAAADSKHLFEALGDRIGVAAALVPLNVNSRAVAGFEFGFDFEAVLDACALAIPDGRVKDALLARKADAEKHANRLGHVFPERDSLALAIYHTAVGFEPWRRVFERGQREPLPHFELEIAAILVAYLVGVATAVTSEMIKDLIKARKKVKAASEGFVTRAELDEKLRYLLDGYNLRDYHLRHPEELDLATFTPIWKALHNKQAVLSKDEKRILQHFRQTIPSFRVSENDADPFASARRAVEDVLLADETENDK